MQHCGTISSSRCQTTCIARSKTNATQIQMHGRMFETISGLPSRRSRRPPAFALWAPARQPSSRSASEGWWSQTESNRRPPACKAGALPTELWPPRKQSAFAAHWLAEPKLAAASPPSPLGLRRGSLLSLRERRLVGLGRFELPTSRLSSARSNQLSYKPGPGVGDQKSVIRKHWSLLITEY